MLTWVVGREFTDVSTGTIIAVALAIFAVFVAFYVLRGFGLYRLAKRYNLAHPLLAWFPFTWVYVVGLLLGDVAVFGKKFDKFALVAFIVFTVSGGLYYGVQLLSYFPVIGFFLQGGKLYFSSSTEYFNGMTVFGTELGYLALVDFIDPYSEGFWTALNILSYVARIIRIISFFFIIVLYSNFFRCFLPNHYFIATLFSIFGLFGPWAFVVRNNERVNYAEYMRSRYASFYGTGGGYNGYNGYDQSSYRSANNDDPFEETSGDDGKNTESDDPFGEFNDKK